MVGGIDLCYWSESSLYNVLVNIKSFVLAIRCNVKEKRNILHDIDTPRVFFVYSH